MSSIGVATATVVRQPRVRLAITGNELLPAGSKPRDHQITDANGPMLAALAERDGAIVDFPGLIRDDADAMRTSESIIRLFPLATRSSDVRTCSFDVRTCSIAWSMC